MIVDIPQYDGIGVYKITNIATGRVYIGSSINCNARLKKHSKHPQNQQMEADAKISNFTAEILLKFPNGCTGRQLRDAEYKFCIEHRRKGEIYNHPSHFPVHNYQRGNPDDYIYPKHKQTKLYREYDRINFTVPKGTKEQLKAYAKKYDGGSVNDFIRRAIREAIERDETKS